MALLGQLAFGRPATAARPGRAAAPMTAAAAPRNVRRVNRVNSMSETIHLVHQIRELIQVALNSKSRTQIAAVPKLIPEEDGQFSKCHI